MARKKRTAVQSANKKEFDRLRKNILARMKYREKQGFTVDYTTRPKSLINPTKRDIERLKKTQVGISKTGKIEAVRPRKGVQVAQPTREQVKTSKEILAERQNEPLPQRAENVDTGLDYVGMVYGMLQQLHEHAQIILDNDGKMAEEFYNAFEDIFEKAIGFLDEQVAKHGEERVNEYFRNPINFSNVSTVIAGVIHEYDSQAERKKQNGISALEDVLTVS